MSACVQVEAKKLKPNTKYFYQFRYRVGKSTVYSQIGATRTIPLADDDIARTRIAFFGCSNLVRPPPVAVCTPRKL